MFRPGDEPIPGYRLDQFLGRGEFGEVWKSSAPGGTHAALKFILLDGIKGQTELKGMQRIKEIRHPHLMPTTALWLLDTQGLLFSNDDFAQAHSQAPAPQTESGTIVSQPGSVLPKRVPRWLVVAMLLGDQHLGERLEKCQATGEPGIPQEELITYMEEAAKGLDFLNSPVHDMGKGPVALQHADIKPANMMIVGGSIMICDFGVARILDKNNALATKLVGSPAYMAPECIEQKPSRSSDQYALAITYYQLRTGRLPFPVLEMMAVLTSHREGKLNFTHLPPAELKVLQKATNIAPDQRYKNCAAFVAALRQAVSQSGVLVAQSPRSSSQADEFDERTLLEQPSSQSDKPLPILNPSAKSPSVATKPSSFRWEWKALIALMVVVPVSSGLIWIALQYLEPTPEPSPINANQKEIDPPSNGLVQGTTADQTKNSPEESSTAKNDSVTQPLPPLQPISLTQQTKLLSGLAFTPNWLISISDDGTTAFHKLDPTRDTVSASYVAPLASEQEQNPAVVLATSLDHRWVATGYYGGKLALWDLTAENPTSSKREVSAFSSDLTSIVFSTDSRNLCAADIDGNVKAISLDDFKGFDLQLPSPAQPISEWRALFLSQTGEQLLGLSIEGTLVSWSLATLHQPATVLIQSNENPDPQAWSLLDKNRLISGYNSGALRLFDLTTGKVLAEDNSQKNPVVGLSSIALQSEVLADNSSINGYLCSREGGVVSMGIYREDQLLRVPLKNHSATVRALATATKDPLGASAGDDGLTVLYRFGTLEKGVQSYEMLSLPSHLEPWTVAAFSADGKWLAIGDQQGKLQLYPIEVCKQHFAEKATAKALDVPTDALTD